MLLCQPGPSVADFVCPALTCHTHLFVVFASDSTTRHKIVPRSFWILSHCEAYHTFYYTYSNINFSRVGSNLFLYLCISYCMDEIVKQKKCKSGTVYLKKRDLGKHGGGYQVTSTGWHGGSSAVYRKKADALKFFKRECVRQS